MTNTTTQPAKLMGDMYTRLYRVCNLITLLKEVNANADAFNSGHEEAVHIVDETLLGVFDSLDDICEALHVESGGDQEVQS
jgi:hypothetical protein